MGASKQTAESAYPVIDRRAVAVAIDHKTISRKHFVIEVGNVKEGDGVRSRDSSHACHIS